MPEANQPETLPPPENAPANTTGPRSTPQENELTSEFECRPSERALQPSVEDIPDALPSNDEECDSADSADKTKTKKRRRKPTTELQSNKGWAEGSREVLLEKHVLPYKQARALGQREGDNYLSKVVNEFTYIYWGTAEREEPAVRRSWTDTTTPDDDSQLTDSEKKAKADWIAEIRQRIRRWLAYRGDHPTRKRPATAAPTTKIDLSDPLTVLMLKLVEAQPPSRATPGLQQFMHEDWESTIQPEVRRRWNERLNELPPEQRVDKYSKPLPPPLTMGTEVARELWADMGEEKQDVYRKHAAAEAKSVKETWDQTTKDWPPKDPASRQYAIDHIELVLQKVMTQIANMTGLHVLVMLGGPIPYYHGDIGTQDYYYGENLAPSPVSFNEWDKEHFEANIRAKMKAYLHTAFTPADCAAASLPEDECIGGSRARTSPAVLDERDLLTMPADMPEGPASTTTTSAGKTNESSKRSTQKPGPAKKRKTQAGGKGKRKATSEAETSEPYESAKEGESEDDTEGEDGGNGARRAVKEKPKRGSSAKRRKVAAASANADCSQADEVDVVEPPQYDLTAPAPACPAEVVESWATDAWKELTATLLGATFWQLLEHWVALETAYQWKTGTAYLQARVAPSNGPGITAIGNIGVYDKSWWAWWNECQPSWRKINGDRPVREDPAGHLWEGLAVRGKNGLLTVIATLSWWGQAMVKDGRTQVSRSWLDAIDDVSWVLQELLKDHNHTLARIEELTAAAVSPDASLVPPLSQASKSKKQRTTQHRAASRRYYKQNQQDILEARRRKRKATLLRSRPSPVSPVPTDVDIHDNSPSNEMIPDPASEPSSPQQDAGSPTSPANDALAVEVLRSLAHMSLHPSIPPAAFSCISSSVSQPQDITPVAFHNREDLPPGVTSPSDEQQAQFLSSGRMQLTVVQEKQLRVAHTNAELLTPPGDEDRLLWAYDDSGFSTPFVSRARLDSILQWRADVDAVPAWQRTPGVRRFRPVFADTKQWEHIRPPSPATAMSDSASEGHGRSLSSIAADSDSDIVSEAPDIIEIPSSSDEEATPVRPPKRKQLPRSPELPRSPGASTNPIVIPDSPPPKRICPAYIPTRPLADENLVPATAVAIKVVREGMSAVGLLSDALASPLAVDLKENLAAVFRANVFEPYYPGYALYVLQTADGSRKALSDLRQPRSAEGELKNLIRFDLPPAVLQKIVEVADLMAARIWEQLPNRPRFCYRLPARGSNIEPVVWEHVDVADSVALRAIVDTCVLCADYFWGSWTPYAIQVARDDVFAPDSPDPPLTTDVDLNLLCRICRTVKSHSVLLMCGHSFCFVCARLTLNDDFKCAVCGVLQYRPPIAFAQEREKIVAAIAPEVDESVVLFNWSGVRFPRVPRGHIRDCVCVASSLCDCEGVPWCEEPTDTESSPKGRLVLSYDIACQWSRRQSQGVREQADKEQPEQPPEEKGSLAGLAKGERYLDLPHMHQAHHVQTTGANLAPALYDGEGIEKSWQLSPSSADEREA
ncbi:hypothetical protein C8F01DRAFT_1360496 [Mycena amicta]|nr:hypothetical protein C8F01DRAFT_1360496 [Mycena amicta]